MAAVIGRQSRRLLADRNGPSIIRNQLSAWSCPSCTAQPAGLGRAGPRAGPSSLRCQRPVLSSTDRFPAVARNLPATGTGTVSQSQPESLQVTRDLTLGQVQSDQYPCPSSKSLFGLGTCRRRLPRLSRACICMNVSTWQVRVLRGLGPGSLAGFCLPVSQAFGRVPDSLRLVGELESDSDSGLGMNIFCY